MGISRDEFETLPVEAQQEHIRKHEYYMGERKGNAVGQGPALIDFYDRILGAPLNCEKSLISNLGFSQLYRHCIGCGDIYEQNFNGNLVGNLPSLPVELKPFLITTGFCGRECIDKAREITRRNSEN